MQEDYYEWENVSSNASIREQACRYIFVRDVYKSFCIHGINVNLDSIDKVATELMKLTEGKKVITVGSSAGGYMALVFGLLLNASAVYAFAPQISLETYNHFHPVKYIEGYRDDKKIQPYLSIANLIKDNSHSELFIMYPTLCGEDVAQMKIVEAVQNDYVHLLKVKHDKHGTPIYGASVAEILGFSLEQSKELYDRHGGKEVTRERILFETNGICKALVTLVGSRFKALARRLFNSR